MTSEPIRRLAAVAALALAVAACGDRGGTADVGAEPGRTGEDSDNPTPAPPPPTIMEGCPADRPASPQAAGEALSGTYAWSVLERERVDDLAAVSSRSDGVLTGTVTGVEQGGRFQSEQDEFLGIDDGSGRSARLTVNLIIDVEEVEGALSESIRPGTTVAVPLVVFDGSVEGLPEDQVEVMHTNYSREFDCAVPRSDVIVVGTASDLAAAGEDTVADAVIELPRTLWLPDPGAVAFRSDSGVESLDWLVGADGSERFFNGAGTLDEVAAAATNALG